MLMHLFSLRAFQRDQKHDLKHPSLVDLKYKQNKTKQTNNSLRNGFAQCYDHDQYFIPKTNSLGRKKNKFRSILFSKMEYSKLINCLGGMCQTYQCNTIYGMFGINFFEN